MSPPTGARPPAWARRMLENSLAKNIGGRSVAADLEQEFHEVLASRGEEAARRWYVWEALKLSLHFRWARFRGSEVKDPLHGRLGIMEVLGQNIRLTLRRLTRAPGFAAVAVITMALGIGANVAIFSVVRAVLLDPLPYGDSDELAAIWEWNIPRDRPTNVANPGNVRAWRERSRSFEAISAVSMTQPTTVTVGGTPEEANLQYAEHSFFELLGVEATAGRTFTTAPGGADEPEAVLSYGYWQRRFGGDPAVLGQPLQIGGGSAVIVGVLPAQYMIFGEQTDVWVGFDMSRGDQTNSGRWLYPVGRLAADVSMDGARAEMEAIAEGLVEEFPDFNAGWSVNVVPLKEQVVGDVSQALWILLGAVGLLLLIACANVANLFLVRATERQREMAVRTSLGASGRSLVGQLMTETVAVAVLGAALGVLLAHLGTEVLAQRMPDAFALPRIESAGVDGTVLGFAVVLTLITALLFGLVPAIQAGKTKPAATLNAEGRGPSRHTGRLRNALVVAEVAVSVLLLAGAALFGRSLITMLAVDPGIDAEQVHVARVTLSGDAYDGDQAQVAFFAELIERMAASPGVRSVGGITFLPMDGQGAATNFYAGDRPVPASEDQDVADIRNVAGDYFGAMGIGLMQGRLFGPEDHVDGPQTIVVNRALADAYWPGETAVGKPVVIRWVDDTPWEIVGVVEDVRLSGLDIQPRPAIYLHYPKATFFPWLQLTVRSTGDVATVGGALRETLRSMDAGIPMGNPRVMEDIVRRASARPRMTTVLMLVFAALATLLAAVGLYGVLSYTVSQRVREIGVRAALGARPSDVLRMVVGQGTRLALMGLVLGLGAALAGGRLVASALYGVEPSDPLAFGSAGILLLAVTVAACAIPAWRASRVAPAEALRSE